MGSVHSNTKTVLVVLDLCYASAREQLSGIYRFQTIHGNWNIRLIPSNDPRFQSAIEQSLAEGVDGAIVKLGSALDVSPVLSVRQMPLVLVEHPSRKQLANIRFPGRPLAIASIDNRLAGELAAKHLHSLGNFATYVFVHDPNDNDWSRQRGNAFKATLRRFGHPALFLSPTDFERQIMSLPKPLAIFAAFDLLATDVLKICQRSGLTLPKDAMVLGIDNDQFLCENVRPTLSSIRLDHEHQGFVAAELLNALMSGQRTHLERMTAPLDVVARNSTAYLPPAHTLVNSATHLIQTQAIKGIRVTDIAHRLGVSTSLLKIRFRQLRGHSIRDELVNTRLNEVKRLLQSTDYTISQIARTSGFSSSVTLNHLFRKRFSMTPSQWRNELIQQTQTLPTTI